MGVGVGAGVGVGVGAGVGVGVGAGDGVGVGAGVGVGPAVGVGVGPGVGVGVGVGKIGGSVGKITGDGVGVDAAVGVGVGDAFFFACPGGVVFGVPEMLVDVDDVADGAWTDPLVVSATAPPEAHGLFPSASTQNAVPKARRITTNVTRPRPARRSTAHSSREGVG